MVAPALHADALVALAGNPNVGKSTLFNALTGAQQHVGNWPGVTVEKKEGALSLADRRLHLVDLPGTYSLNAYSLEEGISRDFLLDAHPAAVIAVADAANLERNLYLVTQLMALGRPLVLVLNMADIARSRGLLIKADKLSWALGGVPVVETVGTHKDGIDALKSALDAALSGTQHLAQVDYGPALTPEIDALTARIAALPNLPTSCPPRWLALALLEGDAALSERAARLDPTLLDAAQAAQARILAATDEDAETLITDRRYAFINQALSGALIRTARDYETRSDRIDRVLTHRVWGVPIFLLLMWVVFQFTANVSAPLLDFIDGVVTGPLSRWLAALLSVVGLGGTWVESLLIDGVIAGVGGVLVFVPVLMALYFALGVLEDTGYMARSAFVMDRLMRRIGLHGKSFLPMLVGFGCTVPAVYATRTLEDPADRKRVGFLVSFMSCGARLPVYVVIGSAFFGAQAGALIFSMYLLGVGVAVLTGWVMKRTLYRDQPLPPFIMELPPYRPPNLRLIWGQMWERTRAFIENAATIILAMSVVLWLLMAVPLPGSTESFNAVAAEDSLFGGVSRAIAPAFGPAGFGEWEASSALITGFVAKEVVISTMSQVLLGQGDAEATADAPPPTFSEDLADIGTGLAEAVVLTGQEVVNIVPRTLNIVPGMAVPEADWLGAGAEADDSTTALEGALRTLFTPLSAVAFTVFVLLYTPCMATLAAMRQEFGTRWTLVQSGYSLAVAWIGAVLVYQGGLLLGLGG